MKRQFLLPDPGEGFTEAEIVAWRVTVGQECVFILIVIILGFIDLYVVFIC